MPDKSQKPIYGYQVMYERSISLTLSPGTRLSYCRSLSNFFDRFPKKRNVEQFIPDDIQKFRLAREAEGKKISTIQDDLLALKTFWNWLIKDLEVAAYNPVTLWQKQEVLRNPDGPLGRLSRSRKLETHPPVDSAPQPQTGPSPGP